MGFFNETAEARKFGVSPDSRCLNDKSAARVDCCADHPVAGIHVHGNGFAGKHTEVNARRTGNHQTVGGDFFARSHNESVADNEARDGNARLDAVTHQGCRGCAEAEESVERFCRTLFCTRFDVTPGQDKDRNGSGNFEVDFFARTAGCGKKLERHVHAGHASHSKKQGVERPPEGCENSHADESVHGRSTVPSVDPCGLVEWPCAPHCYGGGESEGEPLPVGELQHGNHRHEHNGHREHGRNDEALLERRRLAVGR